MPVKEIIQMSYLILTANITLLIFIWFNSVFTLKKKLPFLVSTLISLLMVVCNIIMYSFQGTGTHLLLLKVFTAISYAVSGAVILPFILISPVIQKKIRILLQIFASLNILLSLSSIFNGCIFRYDMQGNVSLGKLSPIPFYLSAMYLAVLFAASVIKFRLGLREESIFIMVLNVGIILAVVMNTVFDYKFLISGMAVLSTLFYYLFFTTQTLTRDALTDAFNRHSFYKDIESMKKKQMFIISMDLNGLKQINDTLGHDEGDKAILAAAESAFQLLPARFRLYRMGGDEFEILCPNCKEEEILKLTAELKASVQNKNYSIAVGYAEYQKDSDFEEIFRQADVMMYDDKLRMKRLLQEKHV